MPLGPGGYDSNGIWQYGEDDSEALASDLLNLGMQSVSDTIAALGGGFDASITITATDATWTVPTLGNPIVKVTAIGGGGGGGSSAANVNQNGSNGSNGGTTTFNAGGAGTVTATGGVGGIGMRVSGAVVTNASDGFIAGNGGPGAASIASDYGYTATSGHGGQITTTYLDLTGISTVNVTIGAGGAGGTTAVVGGDGGDGVVIFEYVAG